MSVRIDIEWPDGAIETRLFAGLGPWTIGGHDADVNLPDCTGVAATVFSALPGDAVDGGLMVSIGASRPIQWTAATPITIAGVRLHAPNTMHEDDVATVALLRPDADALSSVALSRPAIATGTEAGAATHHDKATRADVIVRPGDNHSARDSVSQAKTDRARQGPARRDDTSADPDSRASERTDGRWIRIGLWSLIFVSAIGVAWVLWGSP